MKNYKEFSKNTTIIQKLKKVLIFLGFKKLISKLISIILFIILKSKNSFLRSVVFDFSKNISDIIFYKNKYGERFCLFTNDNIISKQIFISEEFDLGKFYKVINFLNVSKKIENLYDIGANIGTICIPAVKRNLVKKAYAIEPVRKNFDLLKINIMLNDLKERIDTFNYALSSEDDKNLVIELAHGNSGDHRVRLENLESNLYDEKSRQLEKVKSKKFDSLFKNLSKDKDLVWMDTQGFEPLILDGAKNLIDKEVPIVIEFWPYGLKRNNLWGHMRKIIEKYKYYADLSYNEIILKKINQESLDDLFSNWDEEKKDKTALFTDLLLLHNN
jgi:FkbM family methyltransferase